jgi:hypothetical protein
MDLTSLLNKQNEWILIDFIDIVRQALLHPAVTGVVSQSELPRGQPAESLLSHALELLNQWGFYAGTFEPDSNTESFALNNQICSRATPAQSLLSLRRLHMNWHSLMLMIKGELKLSWGESDTNGGRRRASFWRSIASFLHFDLRQRRTDVQMLDVETLIDSMSPATDEPARVIIPARELGTIATSKQKNTNYPTRQIPAAVPISVQMLGNFNITIQETNLKLPSSRGLSVLKYLLLHHKQNTPREVLMDICSGRTQNQT